MKKQFSLTLFLFCLMAVQGFAQLTAVSLVTPASGGSGTVQTFDVRVAGGAGGYGTDWTQLIISTQYNSTYGIPNSCSILFYPNGNVYIGNDAQTVWQSGSYFGNSGSISNSQCSVNLATAYMTTFGSSRDWIFTITFNSSFTGAKYLSGGTSISGGSVYTVPPTQFGTWTIPGAGGPPTVSLSSPALGGSASVQRFSIVATGADQGWTDLTITPGGQQAAPWTGWAVPNSCDLLFYPNGTMYIGNDAQTTWTQPAAMGSSGMIANSQCSADVGSATNSLSGNSRTYSVTITFNPSFAGTKIVMALASTSGGSYGVPTTFGNWTIPVMQEQIIGYVKESPSTLNPGEVNMSRITLSQSGQDLNTMALRVYHGNDPVTFRIRYARPNSQVWVTRIATVPAGAPSAGTTYVHTVCGPDNGHQDQGIQHAILDPVNGDNYGACYLGMTDAAGYLEWTGQIWYSTAPQTYGEYLSGMISAQFYIGPQTFNPNFPGITDGPMNEDNYVGALVYWVIGSDGYQGPAPY